MSFPWGVSRRLVKDMQSHCLNAQISLRISLCSSSSLPLQQCLSNISLCGVNSCEMPSSQSLSEVRVVLVSPRHMAGWDACLVEAAIWGGRQMDSVWQPVRPALGPSWTMTTTSNLPSWHHENVNSQFSICPGNYQFWSKSFWYAELWVLRTGFDTSTLSSAWPEKLMSTERRSKHHSEKVVLGGGIKKLGRCVSCAAEL